MGMRDWKKGFESEREYVSKKGGSKEVIKYADGFLGARECYVEEDVCQSGQCMRWKYEGKEECGCASRETMEHVLLECDRYVRFRREWKG